MNQINITLTGFMGTGKSTVGQLLAEQHSLVFVDSDNLIEERDGRSVATIFREEGEPFFRRLEAEIARELAKRRGMVIATGGRMMLDANNAAALEATGPVFCLTAEADTILDRLADEPGQRPLLDVPDPWQRVRELQQEREAGYGRFAQIDTTGKTPQQIASQITVLLDKAILPIRYPNGRYEVVVGPDLLPVVRELAGIGGPLAIITDSNVGPLHSQRCGEARGVVTMPAGEEYKTLATVRQIYDELLATGLDRQGTILALGGGVVGDVAGFVAATYLRGIDLVQCPTSLLAMVDASVGGKCGVDLPQGKNLIGAFKQPVGVFADLSTLVTLPAEEFAAGMAEVIKAGLIADPPLFMRLASGPGLASPRNQAAAAALSGMIAGAIRVKRDVVEEDPFEKGRRAVLNLGHTFAHTIEQVSGYAVRHGEAVAMGLVAAAHLSAALGHCDPALQPAVEAALQNAALPTRIPVDLPAPALYAGMGSDKKKTAGKLRFVLLRDVGDVFVAGDVPEDAVLKTLRACGAS
jgi:3-dehydroquinate synthase